MPHNLKAHIGHYPQPSVPQLVREEEARADSRLRCSLEAPSLGSRQCRVHVTY